MCRVRTKILVAGPVYTVHVLVIIYPKIASVSSGAAGSWRSSIRGVIIPVN